MDASAAQCSRRNAHWLGGASLRQGEWDSSEPHKLASGRSTRPPAPIFRSLPAAVDSKKAPQSRPGKSALVFGGVAQPGQSNSWFRTQEHVEGSNPSTASVFPPVPHKADLHCRNVDPPGIGGNPFPAANRSFFAACEPNSKIMRIHSIVSEYGAILRTSRAAGNLS